MFSISSTLLTLTKVLFSVVSCKSKIDTPNLDQIMYVFCNFLVFSSKFANLGHAQFCI